MLKPLFAAVMGMVAPTLSVIASETSDPVPVADRSLFFDIFASGQEKPIEWGLDTAWPDEANMRRGVRFLGSDIIDVARVSFQPWAQITEKGVLPDVLRNNLAERMRLVGLIGHKVNIALNLDAGDPTLHDVYDNKPAEWAKLIDATAAAVQEMGYTVVSAAPFNEPDYQWNGLSQFIFSLINSTLKNADNYPRFQSIRLSGGNTLNCDEALPWYNALKSNLDEGNTHQLAGSFDNYANFFQTVRADGKHATADELHNVMEAMVGVEYGMQTGIWWGHADLVRGEFCKVAENALLMPKTARLGRLQRCTVPRREKYRVLLARRNVRQNHVHIGLFRVQPTCILTVMGRRVNLLQIFQATTIHIRVRTRPAPRLFSI